MSTTSPLSLERLIWLTRGRNWGFRFLLNGGLKDPLAEFELAVSDLGDESSGCAAGSRLTAVRFQDPEGRRDYAGRVIPHDFVVPHEAGLRIDSVEDALRQIWPLVADAYTAVWDSDPPEGPVLQGI